MEVASPPYSHSLPKRVEGTRDSTILYAGVAGVLPTIFCDSACCAGLAYENGKQDYGANVPADSQCYSQGQLPLHSHPLFLLQEWQMVLPFQVL